MNLSEYESEPIDGLPDYLPDGEHILWQGSPERKSFSKHVFHLNKLLIYFGILIAWNIMSNINAGSSIVEVIVGTSWIGILTLAAISILMLFSWMFSKSTLYTITNRRLVLRFGVAIPMIINMPWEKIRLADLKVYPDESGDISLTLIDGEKISYFVLWPHVKPWKFSSVRPMLRSIPKATQVGTIIADALSASMQTSQTHEKQDKKIATDNTNNLVLS